ncbi:MAG: outer membrane protein assembly factor BamC [Pseudomonadota bacterium]
MKNSTSVGLIWKKIAVVTAAVVNVAIIMFFNSGCSWLMGKNGPFPDRSVLYQEAKQQKNNQWSEGETRPIQPEFPIPGLDAGVSSNVFSKTPRVATNTWNFSGGRYRFNQLKSNYLLEVRPYQADQTSEATLKKLADYWDKNKINTTFIKENQAFVTDWVAMQESQSKDDEKDWFWKKKKNTNGWMRFWVSADPNNTSFQSTEYFKYVWLVESSEKKPKNSRDVITLESEFEKKLISHTAENQPEPSISDADRMYVLSTLSDLTGFLDSQMEAALVGPVSITFSLDGNGIPMLSVNRPFTMAWGQVGKAIQSSDLTLKDLDRSIGTYFITLENTRLENVKSSSDSKDAIAEWQVKLLRGEQSTLIAVQRDDENPADTEVSRFILEAIQKKYPKIALK